MPIREMLIAFFIVLAIGAVMNDWPKDEDPLRNAMSGIQPGNGTNQDSISTTGVGKPLFDNPLIATGTESNFKEEVLDAKNPVLVEFYMEDDVHCKNMAPTISELSTEYQDALKVVRVDVMTNPALMQKYEIGPLPGLVIFKNGKKMQTLMGEMTKAELAGFLTKYMNSPASKANHSHTGGLS